LIRGTIVDSCKMNLTFGGVSMNKVESHILSIDPATMPGALLWAGIFAAIGIAGVLVIRGVARASLKRDRTDPTAILFLRPLAQFLFLVVLLVVYAHLVPQLRSIGTALLAGASVISIVLGVAAQNTLGNLIAGIALLVYRPFRIGDRLQVMAPTGVESGIVESVTLGYTVIQTVDNRRVVLPNSLASSQTTVNLSSIDARIMGAVPVGIAYNADIDRARKILLEIARSHPDVSEIISCPVIQLGASSVTLSIRAWCRDAIAAQRFEWDVFELAKTRFASEGIEIPYPYQNVIVRKEE
jgi:small conductance mechanosensitive channel